MEAAAFRNLPRFSPNSAQQTHPSHTQALLAVWICSSPVYLSSCLTAVSELYLYMVHACCYLQTHIQPIFHIFSHLLQEGHFPRHDAQLPLIYRTIPFCPKEISCLTFAQICSSPKILPYLFFILIIIRVIGQPSHLVK